MKHHGPAVEMSYEKTNVPGINGVTGGFQFVYRFRCTCGLIGAPHPTKRAAIADRDSHRAAIAPPDPPALFDVEEIT